MPDNKDNTTQAKEQVTRHVTLSHVNASHGESAKRSSSSSRCRQTDPAFHQGIGVK